MNQKTRNTMVASVIAALIAFAAIQAYLTPANANECILSNIGNAKSDTAAKLVAMSCRNIFNKK
jgi:hypothetical protein